MELQSHKYDPNFYNLLPSIEFANEEMRRHGRLRKAEQVLGPIFSRHQMSSQWGVALLHRHWWLGKGEMPVQNIVRSANPKEYETSPHEVADKKQLWPALMAIDSDPQLPLVPLEFSSDEAVGRGHEELVAKESFIRDLQSAMVKTKLNKTFGLVFTRDVDHLLYELVEFNSEKRASVLKESTPEEAIGMDTIQTSWRFSLDGEGTTCTSTCWSRCVIPSGGGSHRHEHPRPHSPHMDGATT